MFIFILILLIISAIGILVSYWMKGIQCKKRRTTRQQVSEAFICGLREMK